MIAALSPKSVTYLWFTDSAIIYTRVSGISAEYLSEKCLIPYCSRKVLFFRIFMFLQTTD